MPEIEVIVAGAPIQVEISGAQGPRGIQGEVGPGGVITNASVNAAIETDSAATRDSLGLGSAALGDFSSPPAIGDVVPNSGAFTTLSVTEILTAPRITGRCDGLEVLCKAGLAINAGQVVYVTGASGNNIIIGLAQANAEVTSSKTIGISESTLANNATGYAITEGLMTVSISAPSAAEGDPIWLSPSTAGGMVFGIANKPLAPNHIVYLGVVTRKTGNKVVEIYVKIQNGAELDELSDVLITSPVEGQALMRGATLWENRSLAAADISDLGTAATTDSTDYATAVHTHISADVTDATSNGDANKGKILKTNGSGFTTLTRLVTTALKAIGLTGIDVQNNDGTSLLRIGTGTSKTGIAEGYETTASGYYSHAEGYETTASGGYSHAEGISTIASGEFTHAEGNGASAIGLYAHAEGGFTIASGNSSHAEGYETTASGGYSHAAGRRAKAIYDGSRVMSDSQDDDVSSTATNQMVCRYESGYEFFGGNAKFYGGVLSPNQQLNMESSVVTRATGDARYGTYSDILDADFAVASNTNLVTVLSITLPVGLYQIDAFLSSQHNAAGGCKIRFGATVGGVATNIKVGLNDSYSRPLVASPIYPLSSSVYNQANTAASVVTRSDVGANEFRRSLNGIVEILTEGTKISLDYAQQTANAAESKARARSHIIARRIN